MAKKVFCHKHPETALVCPRCKSSEGGKAMVKKYTKAQMRAFGKMGGRPRKPVVEGGLFSDELDRFGGHLDKTRRVEIVKRTEKSK